MTAHEITMNECTKTVIRNYFQTGKIEYSAEFANNCKKLLIVNNRASYSVGL